MWENRHSDATYIVNHALPATGLRSRDALLEYWAAAQAASQQQDSAANETPAGDA
jgi:acrylyl-CoA reductase (NADPH)/3-hydroxypropionyl-CoA dehydratase/3-hydroxypropionyl-CoA synthetase